MKMWREHYVFEECAASSFFFFMGGGGGGGGVIDGYIKPHVASYLIFSNMYIMAIFKIICG